MPDPAAKYTTILNEGSIIDEIPHLFHYTNLRAALSIIKSDKFRFTDYFFLNDGAELTQFQEVIIPKTKTFLEAHLLGRLTRNEITKIELDKYGGISVAAKSDSQRFIEYLYKAVDELHRPFICSFCDHRTEFEKDHGLLPMWRDYGTDGGYALEVDTRTLCDAAADFNDKYITINFHAADVVYSDEEDKISKWGPHISEMLELMLNMFTDNASAEEIKKIHMTFLAMAARYKNAGFKSEQECRIVMYCLGDRNRILEQERRELVNIEYLEKNGTLIPYFEMTARSAISRIIVGPHPAQTLRKASLEGWLEKNEIDIPVTVSEIPYRII